MASVFSTIVCSVTTRGYKYISSTFGCRSVCTTPPDNSHFPLDALGIAGIFGGDEATSAMATVHVYESRRWLGWYNSPGSYQIAKGFCLLTQSRCPDSFSPGVHTDPATLLGSDVRKGPKFRATQSGTIIKETAYSATLFMEECASREGKVVEGRKTEPVGVTIAELSHIPELQTYPRRMNVYFPILASIPISISIGTCITCRVFGDWYAFWSIFLGILASGISCLVIGSAEFVFIHPDPSKGSPPGDGILCSGKDFVLLKGAEGAVNSITRGRFSLKFSSQFQYRLVRLCSHLLTIQFIAQLLFVPKSSPLGQIMFAASLAVSWIYNSWLYSWDKEKIQRDILFNDVLKEPVLTRYYLGTRTTAVVFLLLVLQPEQPMKILNVLLPNDTKVWEQWKETVVQKLMKKQKLEFIDTDWYLDGFTQQERSLLETLYGDTQAAYRGYVKYVVSG